MNKSFCEYIATKTLFDIVGHYTSFETRKQVILALLGLGVSVNATDQMGQTPLFYAAHVSTIRLLLELGADPDIVNSRGQTALDRKIRIKSHLTRTLFLVTTRPSWESPGYCKLAKEFAAIITIALLKRTKFQPDMIRMIGRYIRAS